MTLSRRHFLTSTVTLAAATALGVAEGPAAAEAATVRPALRRSTFVPLVGRVLTVARDGRRSRVRLRRIRDVVGAPAGDQESFVLQFGSERPLPDGIYTLSHPRAGRHRLFMSHVDGPSHRRHDIVVNRYVPPEP